MRISQHIIGKYQLSKHFCLLWYGLPVSGLVRQDLLPLLNSADTTRSAEGCISWLEFQENSPAALVCLSRYLTVSLCKANSYFRGFESKHCYYLLNLLIEGLTDHEIRERFGADLFSASGLVVQRLLKLVSVEYLVIAGYWYPSLAEYSSWNYWVQFIALPSNWPGTKYHYWNFVQVGPCTRNETNGIPLVPTRRQPTPGSYYNHFWVDHSSRKRYLWFQ